MSTIMDGKAFSAEIKQGVKAEVEKLKAKGITPCLAVIIVGNNPASRTYVNNKKKACELCGIKSEEIALDESVTEAELLNIIKTLNNREDVNGFFVQLPLPAHINEKTITDAISPEKDVDGFHPVNVGNLLIGKPSMMPCTPAGIIKILQHYNIEIEGKKCVVVGRSNIVGKPMAIMLLALNGTVTVCHSRTHNLVEECKTADVLIAAVGKSKFITADMVKPGAVVVDVGINRDANNKLCGDVDFEAVSPICSYITPVPGGVGPLTIAMLMKNTLDATVRQNNL